MAKNNIRFVCSIMILALIVIVGGISTAYSEVRLKDYETEKDTTNFKLYILGAGVAYSWANTVLDNRGSKRLYCQPGKLALAGENYSDILKKEIEENAQRYTVDVPVELILLQGLIKTFPCK